MFHCGSSIPEAVTSSQIPTVGYFRKRCQKQGNWFGKFSPAKSDQSKGGLAAREFMGVCVCVKIVWVLEYRRGVDCREVARALLAKAKRQLNAATIFFEGGRRADRLRG